MAAGRNTSLPASRAGASEFAGLLIEHFHDAVVGIDARQNITLINSSAERLFGRSRSALVGTPVNDLLPPSVRVQHPGWVADFLAGDVNARFMSGGRAIRYARDDGRTRFLEATIVRTVDFHDETVAVAVLRDVTDQRSILHSLRQAANVFASTREGVIITDADALIISVNQAFTEITGYTEKEVLGTSPAVLSSGRQDGDFYRQMWDSISKNGQWQGEIWNRRKSGEIFPEWLTISVVTDDRGNITNYVGVFGDMSKAKEDEARIDELAHYDSLTKLPNRETLWSLLDETLRKCLQSSVRGALCVCNIDRFRSLNDSLGHAAGDEIVKCVAQRIQACLEVGDTLAHLRGDEFAVLVATGYESDRLPRLGDRITGIALDEPIHLDDGREVFITITVGISVFPDDGRDAQSVIQAAETAMHRAKQDDQEGSWRFHDQAHARWAKERFNLEAELRRAIEREEFIVHYQPLVSVENGSIVGAEALARWMHPDRGLVSPGEFIPVAEESGLIGPIGEWVLRAACREFVAWSDGDTGARFLSVNLSPRQFRSRSLITDIESILADSGLMPEQLSLEITESTLMQYGEETEGALQRLHELGVNLSIDDFGTGYSSLAYLKRFRANHLKIDRSFVSDLPADRDSGQIVAAIIAMATGLEMEIVAEGIETEAQRRFIHAHGGAIMQGFLASPPVDGEEFRAMLESSKTLLPALD